MTVRLWALDARGAQAVVIDNGGYYILAMDNGWQPVRLAGLTQAMSWARDAVSAVSTELEFASIADAVVYVRREVQFLDGLD